MPIVTSRAGTVIDALVTLFTASPTLASPIEIYDGPATGGNTMWTQAVFVGFNGDWHTNAAGTSTGQAYEAVLTNQQLVYVGPTSNREELEIQCVAAIWSGDTNIQAARNSALTLFGAVQTVLRTDPSLGIDGSTVAQGLVGTLEYDYDTGGNVGAAIRFTIHVTTTLLTS